MMFARKRTVPSTPSSFVKLAVRVSSESTGALSSVPTSDQVPLEMYANDPVWAGTPATADAVSCDPTATTGVGSPVEVRRSRPSTRASPTISPGSMIGGKRCSTPNSSRSLLRISGSQSRSVALTRPVVDAFVSSLRASPVSQYASRSGIRSAVRAQSARRSPRSTTR